jgi:hypothetical protein
MYVKMYLNETFSEIQIGRHFSDTFPKVLKGLITYSPLLFKCGSAHVIKRSKHTRRDR